MPRQDKLKKGIQAYVLKELEAIYNENHSSKIQKNATTFPTKKSIIDFVLADPQFFDSSKLDEGVTKKDDQTSVSRTTVGNAINSLIEENKIARGPDGYEFVPHFEGELRKYPILDIAPQIPITVGVPSNILFLTVGSGAAASVAEYLSAQFFKRDIIFIPLGNTIMCIGILPEKVLSGKIKEDPMNREYMRNRIESVLRKFDLHYPDFVYGGIYEIAVAAGHDDELRKEIVASAEHAAENSAYHIIQGNTKEDIIKNTHDALKRQSRMEDLITSMDSQEESNAPLGEQIDAFFNDPYDLDDLTEL